MALAISTLTDKTRHKITYISQACLEKRSSTEEIKKKKKIPSVKSEVIVFCKCLCKNNAENW